MTNNQLPIEKQPNLRFQIINLIFLTNIWLFSCISHFFFVILCAKLRKDR